VNGDLKTLALDPISFLDRLIQPPAGAIEFSSTTLADDDQQTGYSHRRMNKLKSEYD